MWARTLCAIFLLGVLSIGVAFAIDPTELKDTRYANTLISQINKIVSSKCLAYVERGRLTALSKCGTGEVMTGMQSNMILCSKITVDCFTKLERTAESEESNANYVQ